MQISPNTTVSLAPGFSPVLDQCRQNSRFNGFAGIPKAAEAADITGGRKVTGLKPGANERKSRANDFANTH
jgi:hypothetical protein